MAGRAQRIGKSTCQARRRAATVGFQGLDCPKQVADSTTVGTQRLRPSRCTRTPRAGRAGQKRGAALSEAIASIVLARGAKMPRGLSLH